MSEYKKLVAKDVKVGNTLESLSVDVTATTVVTGALASRDWHVEECGGLEPLPVPAIYYMTPEHANCIVEISETFELKQKALAVLGYQLAFSAGMIEQRATTATLTHVLPDYETLAEDKVALGLALHREFDKALALVHGLAGHSGAVMGEAYRREGPFVTEGLLV